jgi:hypothetical protein
MTEDLEDNIHQILHESALREQSFSIFDFNDSFDPKPVAITPEQADDTLRSTMSESIDEIEKSEAGEIERFDSTQEKTCQTFFMPTNTKKLFEEICKNNYTTPSCFLRNVCQRLVESYYGKKEE